VSQQGTLLQLKPNNVLQNFKSYNVLLFYVFESKILYNWIGRKANSMEKESIDNAEQMILHMHPDMRVLRHVTINEQDRNNLEGFLRDIGVSLDDYKDRLRLWNEFEISVYSEIQNLRIEENNCLMLNNLEKVIEAASQITDLAKKINDIALISEKQLFIQKITKKIEINNKKEAIILEINIIIPKLKNSIQTDNVEEAVSHFNRVTLLYKRINEKPSESHQEILDSYLEFYTAWENKISS
jgi:hypothetical protein